LVLLSLLIVLVIDVSSGAQYQDLPQSQYQEFNYDSTADVLYEVSSVPQGPFKPMWRKVETDYNGTTIRIDNASFFSGFLFSSLTVQYTQFEISPFTVPLMLDYGSPYVGLFLSLNNISWLRTSIHLYEGNDFLLYGTGEFVIENSLISSFPFDLKKDDTLYIYIARGLGHIIDYNSNRTPAVSLQCPFDIVRPWYFTIDWKIPAILASIPISLTLVFLFSRHKRLKHLKTGISDTRK